MEPILQHLQQQWVTYAVLAACSLPLIILFRRQVLPVIWYALEITIYLAAFHTVMHFIIRLIRWFKIESTFGALGAEKEDPGWVTPLLDFWRNDLYNPTWLFYFETVVAVLILYAVWRFRPFKSQKSQPKRAPARNGLASSVRPVPSKSGVRR